MPTSRQTESSRAGKPKVPDPATKSTFCDVDVDVVKRLPCRFASIRALGSWIPKDPSSVTRVNAESSTLRAQPMRVTLQ